MRALQQLKSRVCADGVLTLSRSLQRRPSRVRSVCAAQQANSSSSSPGGLRDLYRGLVAAPKQSSKASSGSKSAKSAANASNKQKPSNSAAAASKQTASKPKPTAGRSQEQQKEQDTTAARTKADPSRSTGKQKKAPSKEKLTAAPQPRIPQGSSLPSNGRGFGSIQSRSKSIRKSNHLASAAALATSRSSVDTSTNSAHEGTSSTSSSKVLKVFRFGVDAAAVQKAVDACGWRDRVLQVDVLAQADMLIAVKDSAGGKHQNLKQGERAAHNAGIPFVIVGRRMTKDSLRAALSRYLNPITPEQAATEAAQQAKEAEAKAAADAWFSAATTARFSGTRLPTKNMQQLQQQQQRRQSVGQ